MAALPSKGKDNHLKLPQHYRRLAILTFFPACSDIESA
jgi:hypothetical protein